MKHIVFAILALAVASMARAQPQAPQTPAGPRAVTERVAQLVQDNFYSANEGARIAGELRTAANAGQLDRYTNPFDLAAALTARLVPHDAHFHVDYAPPSAAPPQSAPPANAGQLAQEASARGNYGFAQVQIFPGGIGYLDLRGFSNPSADGPERRAADAAMTMLSGAQAIIIDQRDCAGGSPAMVGYLVAYFTPPNANIFNTFHSRRGDTTEQPPFEPTGARRLDTPLFILNSGRTASACESFAYTLQNAQRAAIVGVASAGGANPSPSFDIGGGFNMQIAVAQSESPITHRNWEGTGVVPNVAAPVEDALNRARVLALQAALQRADTPQAQLETRWALESLQAGAFRVAAADLRNYAGNYGARSVTVDGDQVFLNRDRRPAIRLIPLARDVFALDGVSPLQRVRFERDQNHQVIALVLNLVNGPEIRNTRMG